MLLDLIKKRRSVRRYLDKPVEREKIKLCLEAARLAPSACNAQPWKFIIADDEKLREKLCRAAFSGIYSSNRFAAKAPVIITAVAESGKLLPRLAGKLQKKYYPLIDLGIACEHLILQATESGLGTCWLGWFNEKRVRGVLHLSREEKPLALITLGYPASGGKGASPRKSLEEISSFNPTSTS